MKQFKINFAETVTKGYINNNISIYVPKSILELIVMFYGIYDTSFESDILKSMEYKMNLMELISEKMNKYLKLERLYSGRIDGFLAEQFHIKCDHKGPTISVILNDYNTIFGGYTEVSWTKIFGCRNDVNAFMFQLYPNKKIILQKRSDGFKAVFHRSLYMCGFSGVCDLVIKNKCNEIRNSYAQPSEYEYNHPNELVGGPKDDKILRSRFIVKNIEVFRVQHEY